VINFQNLNLFKSLIQKVCVNEETNTLTTGVDTFAGTAGNDTFTANPNKADGTDGTTLNAFDVINGGAGTDTLNIIANEVSTDSYNSALAGTISNIEIININNTALATASNVDASVGGAALQQLWQIGQAGDISELAATTTAGFRTVSLATALDVGAADGASSVTVALDNVKGRSVAGVTTASLSVTGLNVGTVTVAGTIKASDTAGKDKTVLALDVTVGVDAAAKALKTVTVNSDQTTTLTLTDAGSVKTVDASGSTGGITFDATSLDGISTIKTAGGKDVITVATATAKDNAATLAVETVTATVDTGAGDDKITVTLSGAGKATIAAGDGKDTITVTEDGLATGGTAINAGAGDDKVDVSAVTLTTKDAVVGGDGIDTLVIEGKAEYITADYLTLTAITSGFETLQFKGDAGSDTAVDAAELTAYSKIAFGDTGVIENVAAAQALSLLALSSATSELTATADGYVAATTTPVAATVYAGTLTVASAEDGATLTLNALAAAVTINTSAIAAANVGSFVAGDLKTLTVALNSTSTVNTLGVATGDESLAGVSVTNDETLAALTTLTVTGAGQVQVENTTTKLTSIDLSGMTALVNLNEDGDQVVPFGGPGDEELGYQNLSTSLVALNDNVAETVKLGAARDTVVTASTYAKTDTITGFTLVADLVTDATGKTADAAKSDTINLDFYGAETAWTIFKFAATPANIAAALLEVGAAAKENILFNFDGATYIYQDDNTAGIDTSDTLIKLTGTLDLNLLADVVYAGI
jgi:hypothetical protein